MRGHTSLRLICAAGGVLALCFTPVLAAPVLTSEGSSVTSYLGGTSTVQKTKPRFDQRGSDLEGGARLNGAPGPVAVAPSSGYAAALVGGIDLATLTWAQCDVDFAPPTDGPSVVIGRTFNHRQGTVKGTAAHSPQGYNWFQSAMPEIVSTKSGSASANDRIYVVLGAGKYLEYKRVSAVSSDFIGVNGASGVVVEKLSTYDTYELTDAAGTVWTFWGGNTSGKADWQLWKKTDAAGRSVYVGDKNTQSTALTNGYASGAVVEMYQEYGTGSDLRRYKFTYGQTISSVDHLTEVLVELNTGGSWTSPTEVGRVTYHYYTAATANATDTTDFYGNAGDLEYVRVRVPLSDSGVYDERTKYFRYYEGHAYTSGGSTLNDYAHTLKMVMGHEGARRADIADGGAADSYMGVGNGVSTAEETATLKQYSDAFFTYETGNVDETIASAFFNGECGCSGSSAGTYTFTKVVNSKYATNIANTKYDGDWVTRTVVANPDGSYQTHYFDEVGQPVASVVSDVVPTSATNFWVTGIDRDSDGRVTTVHSPANVTGYTHDSGGSPDGTITYSTSAGLVTLYDRYASGSEPGTNDSDFNGILSGTKFRTGTTSGSAAYLNKSVFSKRSLVVGSSSVVRPMVTESRAFFAASTSHSPGTPANYYNATGYSYAWWNTVTTTDPLYITPKSVTTTLPTVTTGNNGSGSADTTVSYLRKDGRTAISVAADGIYTAVKYNNLGQPTRTVRDADPSVSGDFDTNYGPSNFGLSTLSNGGLKYASEATYDSVGRTVTATAHAGSTPRVSYTHYAKLSDGRLTTITSPLYTSGTPSWTGPFSYTVSNQGGRTEFAATLGPSSAVTTASSSWISAGSDPIDALHSSLSGTNRAYVRNVSTVIYDTPGVKVSEQRKYVTNLPSSGSWTGTAGTDYDKTAYAYDSMGRAIRTVDPTGTIDRTVFDAIGRPRATWTGTSDTNWSSSGNGSGDNMTQTSATAYDGASVGTGLSVGNGFVTRSEAYVKEDATTANGTGDSATARVSTMYYDVRGNLIAMRKPQAPHTVNAYDLMRRMTASASYSATSGVDASVNPLTDDTLASGATIRLEATEMFYDERSRGYKTTRYKVNQSSGADTDSLDSTRWYDSVGRTIKTGGTSLTKTFYDRLGRATHRFTLARCNDSSYGDVLNSVAGDIVLEENQTVYDDAGQTGNVVMTGTIVRNQDDTSTTGALDSNADGNRYKFTAANLSGRAQISAIWYDALDRATDSVAYGTNGGNDFDRRPSSSWLSVPSRGSTPLRTTSVFDAWGRVESVEQPRVRTGTTGYSNKYEYDHASRKVTEIRNYTGGSTSTAARDNDVYTRYVYTNGLMTRMWVDLNGDNSVNTTDQTTDYVFGVVKTGSGSTPPVSQVASNRMLARATYPEQTSGQSTADKSEYFAYNAQREKLKSRDQNGTVHEYTYDTAGRQTIDAVTTAGTSIDLGSGGSNIDTAVLRVERVYDTRGMVSTVTQYDAASSGSVVDQVQNSFDDWGNLKVFQQDYNGTVASSSGDDLGVEYTWSKVNDTSAAGGGNARRSGLRITGTKLQRSAGATTVQDTRATFSNSSSYDDDIGRVTSITDSGGSTTYAEYRYGGVGMVVRTTLSEPVIADELTTTGTSGYNTYLDDFGRIIRNRWRNTTSGAVWYDSKPSYDANSNIIGVENAWVTPWSASYGVDGLNRLDGATVGTLSGGSISNANTWRKETWRDSSGNVKLSQTGNWAAYTAYVGDPSVSGNDEFSQTRTHTLRNEVSGVTESSSWVGGVYSYLPRDARNGSVTRDDINTAQFGFRYFYDAWNRVVKVTNFLNNATIAEYRYNGLGHRIGWKAQFDTGQTYANNKWRYFQYNERWQQVAMYQGTTASNGACGSNAMETYLYHTAGLDGRGTSSYIDKVVFRDRDVNGFASSGTGDGTREERNYYLQNWRNDVVALVTDNGKILERYRYDAYGRPSSFSPADLTGISGGPSGTISGADSTRFYATWSFGGAVTWETDLSDGAGVTGPDGITDNGDPIAFNNYYFASYTGGYGQISDDAIDNRKGLAGYEFDPVLNGNGSITGSSVPLYHVRNRMLNSYTGKWLQKDPLGYHDSMDLYEYCVSDAVDRSDPTGSSCKSAKSKLRSSQTVAKSGTGASGCADQTSSFIDCYVCCGQRGWGAEFDQCMIDLTVDLDRCGSTSGFTQSACVALAWAKYYLCILDGRMRVEPCLKECDEKFMFWYPVPDIGDRPPYECAEACYRKMANAYLKCRLEFEKQVKLCWANWLAGNESSLTSCLEAAKASADDCLLDIPFTRLKLCLEDCVPAGGDLDLLDPLNPIPDERPNRNPLIPLTPSRPLPVPSVPVPEASSSRVSSKTGCRRGGCGK